MIFFFFALIMSFVAFYGLSLSNITRKALAKWLDRFRVIKDDMSENTIQEIGDTLLESYITYKRNKLYYSVFVYSVFLVNAFFTTNLAYVQPIWMIAIVAGANFLMVKWVVAIHKDNVKQMKGIQAIVGKYPQSFVHNE